MNKKTALAYISIFFLIASPFSLIFAVWFTRFWGRSVPVQLLIFLGLTSAITLMLDGIFRAITLLVKSTPALSQYKYIALPFLLALLWVAKLPIWQQPPFIHEIEITLNKDKNTSAISKVELVEVKFGNHVIPFDQFEQRGFWKNQSGILYTNNHIGKGLYFQVDELLSETTNLNLLFNKSEDSARVTVRADGFIQEADLAGAPGLLRMKFSLESGGYAQFLLREIRHQILLAACLLLILLLCANLYFFNEVNIKKKSNQVEDRFKILWAKIFSGFTSGIKFPHLFKSRSVQKKKSKNQPVKRIFAYLLVITSAIVCGLWFKITQLKIIDAELVGLYPISSYLFTLLVTVVVFMCLWWSISLLDEYILGFGRNHEYSWLSALPFLAFLFSVFNFKILFQLILFLCLNLIKYFLLQRVHKPVQIKKLKEPVLIFLILLIFFLVAFKSLSPLYNVNPFTGLWGRMDLLPVYEAQFESGKAYDFSGMFTQRTRLGGNANGIGGNSELLAIIALILDVPVVDIVGKYTLIRNFIFMLYILGAFGMYMYLKYGLKLLLIPSLIGALGFVYGNAAFLSYLGGEFFQHQGEYLFLPWVFLILKIGHDMRSPALIGLAGLVAALPEFVWNVHPEMRIISYVMTNAYNLYLSISNYLLYRSRKALLFNFSSVFIFPFFLFMGIAFRLFHIADLLLSQEFSVQARYRITNAPMSFIMWGSIRDQFLSLFFYYKNPPNIEHFQSSTAGAPILYYTGQFIIMLMCFVLGKVIADIKEILSRRKSFKDLLCEANFFFFMFFFSLLILLKGSSFPLFKWLDFLPFNLHYPARVLIYLFVFALLTGAISLNRLLIGQYSIRLILITAFLLIALLIIISIFTEFKPDNIYFEVALTIVILIGFLFAASANQPAMGKFSAIFILLLAFLSFTYADGDALKFLSPRVEIDSENIFVSLRSAVAEWRNNQHDLASQRFIEKRIADFMQANQSNSNAPVLNINQTYDATLTNFTHAAEAIDNYLIQDPGIYVFRDFIASSDPILVPLGSDTYNAVNLYLPSTYNTFVTGFPHSVNVLNYYLFGLGNNFDANSISHYGGYGLYQTISIYPHILTLSGEKEQPFLFACDLNNFVEDIFVQKVANISGVDYLIYLESLFPDLAPKLLENGYDLINRDEKLGVAIYKNPISYGKVYIADKSIFIRLMDYYANVLPASEKSAWPFSKRLINSFQENINKIPNGQKRVALIEYDGDTSGLNVEPSATSNTVSTKKILASKALFEVNCRESQCWLIYNSAYLKGWKAYLGSQPVPIYRANLGFLALQVPEGQHTVWMEYRPDSRLIGEVVTLLGWLLIIFLLTRQKQLAIVEL